MDHDNVWSPGEGASAELGTGRYGEGLWINQAFSLDVALRYAWALFTEKPVLLLGTGAAVWFLFSLPSMVGLGASTLTLPLQLSGDPSAVWVDLASTGLQLFLSLVLWPFQWIAATGAIVVAAEAFRTGEARFEPLWRTVVPGLFVLLYRILTSLIVLGVAMLPLVLLAGGLYLLRSTPEGMLVLVALGAIGLALLLLWVSLPLALGILPIALDGANPLEAVRIAWAAGTGARVTLFVFGLVFTLLLVGGCCLGWIGQIPVYGVFAAASAAGWLLYSRPAEELQTWDFFRRHGLP